jgi:hypothetical protein
MNITVPQKAENFWTSWVTISFSRRTLVYGVKYNYYITTAEVSSSVTIESSNPSVSQSDPVHLINPPFQTVLQSLCGNQWFFYSFRSP